jgi:hypothetical protein
MSKTSRSTARSDSPSFKSATQSLKKSVSSSLSAWSRKLLPSASQDLKSATSRAAFSSNSNDSFQRDESRRTSTVLLRSIKGPAKNLFDGDKDRNSSLSFRSTLSSRLSRKNRDDDRFDKGFGDLSTSRWSRFKSSTTSNDDSTRSFSKSFLKKLRKSFSSDEIREMAKNGFKNLRIRSRKNKRFSRDRADSERTERKSSKSFQSSARAVTKGDSSDKVRKLTTSEKIFAVTHPELAAAFYNSSQTSRTTVKNWAGMNLQGASANISAHKDANALLHATWNGLMVRTAFNTEVKYQGTAATRTRSLSEAVTLAKVAGDAHEETNPKTQGDILAREMDLKNNEVGRTVAAEELTRNPNATEQDIFDAMVRAYEAGRFFKVEKGKVVPATPSTVDRNQA